MDQYCGSMTPLLNCFRRNEAAIFIECERVCCVAEQINDFNVKRLKVAVVWLYQIHQL